VQKSGALPSVFRGLSSFFARVFAGKDFWNLGQARRGKVLDVGCAVGSYLVDLKKDGWDAYGVEKSGFAADLAGKRGLKVFRGEFEKTDFPPDTFDVITMRSVIEHLYDPKKALQNAKRILKRNGLLLIETININSPEARFFGKKWSRLQIPRHVFFFEPSTIRKYLEQAGFKSVEIGYSYEPPIILRSIDCVSDKAWDRMAFKGRNCLVAFINSRPGYGLFFIFYSLLGRAFKIPAGRIRIRAVKA
jgi:SAM-dependent methyltransferase